MERKVGAAKKKGEDGITARVKGGVSLQKKERGGNTKRCGLTWKKCRLYNGRGETITMEVTKRTKGLGEKKAHHRGEGG